MYFDNAATTFPKAECVYKIMDEVSRTCCVNAGRGSYKLAIEAAGIIDRLRHELVSLVHMQDSSCVVLSSSITMALNQILNGLEWIRGDNVYVSPFEHNAIARTVHYLKEQYGIEIIEMPVNNKDEIDLEALKYLFSLRAPKCVCVNHISNVTGYILPIQEIFEEAKKYDCITILDTAQSLGLLDVNTKVIKADYIAFTGHKSLYGPFGIGGFIANTDTRLRRFIVGGTGSDSLNLNMSDEMPIAYEASSPNIVAIAGLLEALKWRKEVNDVYTKEKMLTNYLVEKLKKIPELITYLPYNLDKHIGIVSINIDGYTSDELGQILDQDFDMAVRTGYHCAPFVHRLLKDDPYKGTVRISVGYFNTTEEIDQLVAALTEIIDEL